MNERPEFSEFGIAAIKLLQGVVYEEDKDTWSILLGHETDIDTYFCRIGINVVIDRTNGLAFLKQFDDDQRTGGYERLPRLITRTPLSYQATLGCVLLRDEYRKFEDEDWKTNVAWSRPRRCLTDGNRSFPRLVTTSHYERNWSLAWGSWKNLSSSKN